MNMHTGWAQTPEVRGRGKGRWMTQTGSVGILFQDFPVPFRNFTCSESQQLERGGASPINESDDGGC